MEKPTLIWGQYEGREEWINTNLLYHTALFNELTDANGDFTYPNYPMVLVDNPADYLPADFTGVTLCFDPQYENWATSIEITMHIKESGVSTYHAYTFTGTGPYVWCPITPSWDTSTDTIVDFYVIIYTAHRPNSRLRFTSMRFGHSYEIPNDMLRSLDVAQSCDLSGISAPFSKMTATIDAAGLDAILGYRQKIELVTNIRHVGDYWVDSIAKAGQKTYTIIALDALGCLASQKFQGANYSGAAVTSVLDDIITNEYWQEAGISLTSTVTGLIPECDRRTALNNLAISYGVVVLSKVYYLGIDAVGIYSPMTNLYGSFYDISPEKTYINPALVYEDQVTSYTITSHSFAQNTNGDVAIGNTRYRDTRTENTYTRSVPIGNETKKTVSQATLITAGTPLTRAQALLAGRYNRQMIWKGSFIWAESSGDHSGRLGAWVRIYDSEGHEIRGAIQRADLVFSGASIKVNAEILSFQLLTTPVLSYDEMDGYFTASYPQGDELQLYKNGEYVATFQDEYYTSDPGNYYVVAIGDNNAYSYHSNTITIE